MESYFTKEIYEKYSIVPSLLQLIRRSKKCPNERTNAQGNASGGLRAGHANASTSVTQNSDRALSDTKLRHSKLSGNFQHTENVPSNIEGNAVAMPINIVPIAIDSKQAAVEHTDEVAADQTQHPVSDGSSALSGIEATTLKHDLSTSSNDKSITEATTAQLTTPSSPEKFLSQGIKKPVQQWQDLLTQVQPTEELTERQLGNKKRKAGHSSPNNKFTNSNAALAATPAASDDESRPKMPRFEYYIPSVPYPKLSMLTKEEQKQYLHLHKKYTQLQTKPSNITEQKEFHQFKELQGLVYAEQEDFMKYLQDVSLVLTEEYHTVPEETKSYIDQVIAHRLRRVHGYPQYYVNQDTVPIVPPKTAFPVAFYHVKTLLNLGGMHVTNRMGLKKNKKEFLMHKCDDIERAIPCNSPELFSKKVCSEDPRCEQLAAKHHADIVVTSSALNCLVNNHAPFLRQWEIPFEVRDTEVELPNGDRKRKRTVFIDKPFVSKSMTAREQVTWFAKFALKARMKNNRFVACFQQDAHEDGCQVELVDTQKKTTTKRLNSEGEEVSGDESDENHRTSPARKNRRNPASGAGQKKGWKKAKAKPAKVKAKPMKVEEDSVFSMNLDDLETFGADYDVKPKKFAAIKSFNRYQPQFGEKEKTHVTATRSATSAVRPALSSYKDFDSQDTAATRNEAVPVVKNEMSSTTSSRPVRSLDSTLSDSDAEHLTIDCESADNELANYFRSETATDGNATGFHSSNKKDSKAAMGEPPQLDGAGDERPVATVTSSRETRRSLTRSAASEQHIAASSSVDFAAPPLTRRRSSRLGNENRSGVTSVKSEKIIDHVKPDIVVEKVSSITSLRRSHRLAGTGTTSTNHNQPIIAQPITAQDTSDDDEKLNIDLSDEESSDVHEEGTKCSKDQEFKNGEPERETSVERETCADIVTASAEVEIDDGEHKKSATDGAHCGAEETEPSVNQVSTSGDDDNERDGDGDGGDVNADDVGDDDVDDDVVGVGSPPRRKSRRLTVSDEEDDGLDMYGHRRPAKPPPPRPKSRQATNWSVVKRDTDDARKPAIKTKTMNMKASSLLELELGANKPPRRRQAPTRAMSREALANLRKSRGSRDSLPEMATAGADASGASALPYGMVVESPEVSCSNSANTGSAVKGDSKPRKTSINDLLSSVLQRGGAKKSAAETKNIVKTENPEVGAAATRSRVQRAPAAAVHAKTVVDDADSHEGTDPVAKAKRRSHAVTSSSISNQQTANVAIASNQGCAATAKASVMSSSSCNNDAEYPPLLTPQSPVHCGIGIAADTPNSPMPERHLTDALPPPTLKMIPLEKEATNCSSTTSVQPGMNFTDIRPRSGNDSQHLNAPTLARSTAVTAAKPDKLSRDPLPGSSKPVRRNDGSRHHSNAEKAVTSTTFDVLGGILSGTESLLVGNKSPASHCQGQNMAHTQGQSLAQSQGQNLVQSPCHTLASTDQQQSREAGARLLPPSDSRRDSTASQPQDVKHVSNVTTAAIANTAMSPAEGRSQTPAESKTLNVANAPLKTTDTDASTPTIGHLYSAPAPIRDPQEWQMYERMADYEQPISDNVTYNLWQLGQQRVMIRCGYHGYWRKKHAHDSTFIHLQPKLEYQLFYGYEQPTLEEMSKAWINLAIRNDCRLQRVHINTQAKLSNEVVKYTEQDLCGVLRSTHGVFNPNAPINVLNGLFTKLSSLPVGKYLLSHAPNNTHAHIKKTTNSRTGVYDLHLAYSLVTLDTSHVPWVPVDTQIPLPVHEHFNRVPCTFEPKDSGYVIKPFKVRVKNKGQHGGANANKTGGAKNGGGGQGGARGGGGGQSEGKRKKKKKNKQKQQA